MKFRDDTDRNVFAYLLETHHWRPPVEIGWLAKIGEAIIVDVGAHGGYTPWLYKHTYPAARVYALEPDRANFALLKANARGTGITCLNAALWHEPDWVLSEGAATNVLKVNPSRDDRAVPAMTLSQLMKRFRLDRIDFLKIDIEGAEGMVLRKAMESLQERAAWLGVKTVLIDAHQHAPVGTYLDMLGFEVSERSADQFVGIRR